MIYFDNAATCGFKPDAVKDACKNALYHTQVNVGRSSYFLSVNAEENVYKARQIMSKHLNNGHIGRLIFTSNCTEALNMMIFGTQINGSEVVTTVTEHNSVLRPLYNLCKQKKLTLKFAEPDKSGKVTSDNVLSLVNDNTAFVIMNAVSNVTGYENEIFKTGLSLKGKIPFLVDGAQAGGHINFDMQKYGISALALAGHKGFYSLQGVGVLALNKNYDITPLLYGGSGNDTFLSVPSNYPERLEAGTLNYLAILSLLHGAEFAIANMNYHNNRLKMLTNRLIDGLLSLQNVKIYSQANIFGIVSFAVDGCDSQQIADILGRVYGVCVRGGFHCAPLMHKFLKTDECGLVRVSLSPYNTEQEIIYFLESLKDAILLSLEP